MLLRWNTNERGFLLLTSYLMFTVISLLSIALFTRGSVNIQAAERNKKKMVAFDAAEAGFDDAFVRIKNSTISSYPWSSGYVSLNTGNIEGGYSTTVTDMGNNIKQISVTGYSPAQTSTTSFVQSRSVLGYIQKGGNSSFDYAAFGATEVTINGNATIDSYDSRLGAYGGSNIAQDGDVGTNATGSDKLILNGSSIVKGDLQTGAGSTPSNVIEVSGSSSYTGAPSAQPSNKLMTVYTSSITSSGNLSLNGNTTYTITAGTYRFSSLKINGSAKLVATGAVTIYVDGEITLNGNGVTTASNTPANMIIYGTSSAKVTLNGTNTFYGAIYSPLAEFEVNGNAKVYGSVIGNDLEINGDAKIHYDASLKETGSVSTSVLSWTESSLQTEGQ